MLVDAFSRAGTITAFTPSWLPETRVLSTNEEVMDSSSVWAWGGVSGTAGFSDALLLSDLGLSCNIGPGGLLRVEFYDDQQDPEADPDGLQVSGTMTFTNVVSETATLGLLAMGAAARC